MDKPDPIAAVREAQDALRKAATDWFEDSPQAGAYELYMRADTLDAVVAEIERLRDKVADADLCLEAVGEARQVLHDHFGGNIAFLDDDLIRGVVKMHEETERQAQEIAALRADAERLDFLDRNLEKRLGWDVGFAPAGTVCVTRIFPPNNEPTPIRAAIDAARAKEAGDGN